jgi:hypothetical protein
MAAFVPRDGPRHATAGGTAPGKHGVQGSRIP